MSSDDTLNTPFRPNRRLTRSPQLTFPTVNVNTLLFSPAANSPSPTVQVFPPRDSHSNCPKCAKFVADGFCCDKCSYWFHPDCIQIPKSLIKRIGNISALKIECQSCQPSLPAVGNIETQTLVVACFDAANQTESVSRLHRFCQTTEISLATHAVPRPIIPATTTSTQTTPEPEVHSRTSVPLLDLTDETACTPPSPAVPANFVIVQGENDPLSNFYQFSFKYETVGGTAVWNNVTSMCGQLMQRSPNWLPQFWLQSPRKRPKYFQSRSQNRTIEIQTLF